MELKNVKIMSSEEVANFKTKLYGKGSDKKQLSSDYCARNIQDLIKKHRDFYDVYIGLKYDKYVLTTKSYNDIIIDNNTIFEEVKDGKEHLCNCGSALKYISNFNFVGCSNYNDKSEKHININYKEPQEIDSYFDFKSDFEFGKGYINEFKKHYNLNFLMSSIIYEFLFEVYGETCYSNELTYNSYQSGVNSASNSKKEELVVKSICKSIFNTAKEQLHFSYYLDEKYYVRIPDLICSKENIVFVFDVKKNNNITDLLKLDLYEKIVSQYLKSKGDNREVKSYHIVYDKDSYDDKNTRTITINTLKNEF